MDFKPDLIFLCLWECSWISVIIRKNEVSESYLSKRPILQKIAKTNRSYTKLRRLCFHYLRQLCKRASVRHYKQYSFEGGLLSNHGKRAYEHTYISGPYEGLKFVLKIIAQLSYINIKLAFFFLLLRQWFMNRKLPGTLSVNKSA